MKTSIRLFLITNYKINISIILKKNTVASIFRNPIMKI